MIHMRPYNAFETRNVKFLVDKQVEFYDYDTYAPI